MSHFFLTRNASAHFISLFERRKSTNASASAVISGANYGHA
jgi:hypothetical protein